MGKKSPSPPPAPDPAKTAAAQGAINKETALAQARLNMVDEFTPYGSSTYSPTGEEIDGIQRYKRTTTLSPAQQNIINQQLGISQQLNTLAGEQIGRVSGNLATPYSYEGLPAAPVADAAARQQTIDALYGQFKSRLDPRFSEEQTALQTQLANQGIMTGSDAYTKELERLGRTKNDAYTSALNQAIASGGAEQSRLFGLQGSARERAIQEYAAQRNAPLNETVALMGAGPGVQNPTFSPIPQTGISVADITGPTALQYQGQMNAYNQQRQAQNATTSGLFGLAGAGLGGFMGGPAFGVGGMFGKAAAPNIFMGVR